MNSLVNTRRRSLHLVTATTLKPATPRSESPQTENLPDEAKARQMAEAILQLQTLRDEFEGEVMSGAPNLDRVTQLIVELAAVRKNVRAYLEANA